MSTLLIRVREVAARHHVVLWEGLPHGGPIAVWPDDDEGFLELALRLNPTIWYVDDETDNVAFAVHGVIHVRRDTDVFYDDLQDWQPRSDNSLTAEQQAAVEAIVADERYEGYGADYVVAEHSAGLDPGAYPMVREAAFRAFHDSVEPALEADARALVLRLSKRDDFDPFTWGDDLDTYVREHGGAMSKRLLRRTALGLGSFSYTSGLRDRVEAELSRLAVEVFAQMPPLTQDQFGFATRTASRQEIAEPFLPSLPANRARRLFELLSALEASQRQNEREKRYATAARRLLALPSTKAAAARRLGISTGVLDRIVTTRTADVVLADDDPILRLAPELSQ